MDRNRFRFAPRTIAFLFFACWLGAARGQDGAYPAPPSSISPDEPMDRLSRIEARLRDLESQNQHLQQRYDELARKYAHVLRQSNSLVFGAEARNPDGQGIPGGLDLGLSSLGGMKGLTSGSEESSEEEEEQAQDEEGVRQQTGAGGAGIRVGRVGLQPQRFPFGLPPRFPFGQPPRYPFRTGEAATREQTGTGGAGVRVVPTPAALMGEYVEQRGSYVPDMRPLGIPAIAQFREGLQIRSTDEFFTFELHNLTQLDGRLFSRTGDALHDNFVIPRQRWYLQGDVTPFATYYTVINRGYGTLDILDSWVDFNFAPKYKEQLQFRVGRMKTPYTYEYIKISESDLIAPERSLFVGNFAGNRQLGVMAHGRLFDGIMEYFVGAFNGPRRSFQDFNNSKDIYTFLNFKPFVNSDINWLKYLNIGGSFNGGNERNPTQPFQLQTANDQSTSAATLNVSPTFLEYKSNVFENGMRMQWSGDLAYYYKSFTLVGGYQGGFQDYSLSTGALPSSKQFQLGTEAFIGVGSSHRTAVPLTGWNVALTYFLTGEEITRRVYLLEPIRPFGWYNGRLNPGAIELYARFSDLQLGSQIFSAGFADPTLWTNRVNTTDIGFNWYLNHYVRFYFDWQHAMFGSPVFISTSLSSKHENLYWFRTQVFF